ncbi:hypothetical protein [Streptomyces spectabilis]|uniref:Uncharacterized protein n=1 Tax=Streptomyces spectabilis TaxID=68270 RepID=A0A516R756_STRST|nr:hypothetical protein [Streptomyces spectabilis]QDQ11492.1 hypothetical protein FH965_13660 [Streptomyces spectabilis]
MALRSDWAASPAEYTILVPGGWFQIPLEPPRERDRGILALAERQFRGVDHAPLLKERLMRDLQKRARAACRVGGVELYLSVLTVGGVPLASSLLVSLVPEGWPGCGTAYDLARRLAGSEVVELEGAGEAVREERTEAPDPERLMGSTLATTTVVYNVPVPASQAWLTLTFSTPMEALAPKMVELFDTVASTLHWQ